MTVFVDESPEERAARLRGLPPSEKLVFTVLGAASPLTQSQVADRSRLSKRTAGHALSKLDDAELVGRRVFVPDARDRLYSSLPVE